MKDIKMLERKMLDAKEAYEAAKYAYEVAEKFELECKIAQEKAKVLPLIREAKKHYRVEDICGFIYGLYQDNLIEERTEEELYNIVDPEDKVHTPAEFWNDWDEENPLDWRYNGIEEIEVNLNCGGKLVVGDKKTIAFQGVYVNYKSPKGNEGHLFQIEENNDKITALRFDPANGCRPVDVTWYTIAGLNEDLDEEEE